MSIKYYNPELETWISYTSNYATGIRIIDTDGNYIHTDGETGAITRATTVEDALKMIARNMTTLEERVEWIYENGTIGGGGGGGSLLPNLKLIEPTSTVDTQDYASIDVSTDEELTVTFSFQSPNIGMGTAYYLVSGDRSLRDSARVSQGIISYKFGKFETGNYNITIYVVDAAGLFSNTLSINIRAGGLEIITNFNDALDFTLDEHIVVDYEVSTVSRSPIEMRFQVDQTITTRTLEKGGAYQWEIGQLRSPGVHRATISATSGDFTSNVITFNLIVASPDSMFIASDFDKTTSLQGRDLTIRYRAAMAGETRALIHKWINGVKQPLDTVFIGTGNYLYWKLGDSLEPGSYVFELQASTTDERSYSEKLRFEVDVINQDFARIYPIKDDYLLAYFMADNKSSTSETKNVWEDRSGKNVSCTLHNFNHVTNGWDGYALNFSGRSYAEIDLSPWASNITNGFTFDIYYKTENIGDLDAKVLWMKNSSTPYQGFYIDTQRCNMVSGTSKTIETFLEDSSDKENWQHATFVVNRKRNLMEIFINGVLTQSIQLSKTESFRFDGKIYLGARNNEGEIDQHGKCSIRAIHVYGRTLEDEEIINNYISCLAYPEAQEKVYRLNYDDRQIPRLDITGDLTGIEASTSVTKEVSLDLLNYQDMERGFNLSNCLISMQGTSSTIYPVINYTINLIENGQNFYFSPKEGWIPECRFTLKANYMDSSSANNLSNARFFGDMMNEYHPYPSQLKNPDCRSTVDGFPIQLYVNGEYAGLYTFNVDRYANRTFGFEPLTQGETDNCMAYEVSANTNTGAGAFMTQGNDAETWKAARREFKYRYHYAGKKDAVTNDAENGNAEILADGTFHKELLELIKWTSDSDNSTFKGELAAHWSLSHLIDYFLFVYVVGLVDNFGKNFVIATWGRDADLNTVFYPMLYDADSCTGLTNEGQLTNGPQIDLDRGSFNTIESRLWSRLIDKQNGFWSEIIERYGKLRQTWFTVDKILEYYNDGFIDQIGQRFYNEDARLKYTKEKNQNYLYLVNGTRREYTKRWLRERLVYLDSVFEYATSFEKKGTIRTNVSDYLSLKIKVKSPRYIKIKWTDSLPWTKYYVGSDKLYEFRSPVPVTNTDNNLDMLGVDGIVEIESFTHLKPSYIQLDGMDNITKCIAQDSELLTEVSIGRNKMLQYIDFSGCTNLGKNELGEPKGSLNVIHCENLKYLDVSGTAFVAVSVVDVDDKTPDPSLAKGSGSIEYFNASDTTITNITIWNQTYLSEIQMSGCEHLSKINVGNCERLHTMNLPDTNISTFTIVDCMALSYINISNTPKLVSLRLDGCPNLETLIMQRINSQNLPELDLTTCPKLKTLDVSHCSFLSKITFAAGYNLLENFYIENSVLTSVRFGKADTFPTYLNLAPFKLKSTGFLNCPSLVEIRGLDYEGTGFKLFYNCYNLKTIQGKIKITPDENISHLFYNCKVLVNLPTMDLTNAVDASETCFNCKQFTMDHAVTIMNALGSALLTSWRFFYGCSGIVGELPQTFFNKVTNLGNLTEFFQSCSGINGTIPPTLLAPLGGSLTNVVRCFENCTGITGPLSDQLFAQNPNLRTTAYCFQGCRNITSTIPANLFSRNPNLVSTYWMFNNCTKLTGNVPNTFFRHNKNLNEVQGTFSNCSGLYGEIPMDFFQTSDGTNFNSLWKANNFFAGCTGLYGELKDTFFKFLPKLQEAAAFFASTKITGTIPENLLTAKTSLTTVESLFKDCTGLTGGIPKNFFNPPISYGSSTRAPLTNLTNITTVFSGCTGLDGSIPTELLKGCTAINKVAGLFQNCRKLIGTIPEDILSYSDEILTISGMFDGCQTLSGSIPANIFKKCSKVTDMTAVFRYAYRLTGGIPEGLFSECFKVVTMEQMFRCCKGIGNPYVNDLNPYAMPTTLFESCYDLQNVNLMFYMYDALGGDDSLKGKIPPKLFEGKTKLLQAQEMFRSCDKLTGTLSRYFCAQSTSLQNISGMFWDCTSLQTIEANIFDYNLNITNVSNTFRNCSALTGPAYPFWEKHSKVTSYGSCYAGASNLTGTIPDNWK